MEPATDSAPPPDSRGDHSRQAADEQRLLQRFAAGDHAAFAQLLIRYQSSVYGYLIRCGVGPTVRDDVFQDIFLKVHRAASSYDAGRPFRPWLFAIAVNTVRSLFRGRRADPAEGECDRLVDPHPTSEQLAQARETAAWLETAVAELPLSQREAVSLVCGENMDQAEAAGVLGMPLATLKTSLRRGRLSLARRLAQRNATHRRETARQESV